MKARLKRLTMSPGIEHKIEFECLKCHTMLSGSSGIVTEDDVRDVIAPSAGDITICIKCQHVMAFDERLRLRELSEMEMAQALADPRIQATLYAMREAERKRQKKDPEVHDAIMKAQELVKQIEPILHGSGAMAIGACLTELTAKFFAGHHPEIRKEIMGHHERCVEGLIPLCEKVILEQTGGQWPMKHPNK